MISASSFLSRGRSMLRDRESSKQRSSSQDCAVAHSTQLTPGNLFSFLSATVKNKYNRFDNFDGDADEDDFDEDVTSDDEAPDHGDDDDQQKSSTMGLSASESVPKVAQLFQRLDMADSKQNLVQQESQPQPQEKGKEQTTPSHSQLEASVHSLAEDQRSIRSKRSKKSSRRRSRSYSVGTIDSLKTTDEKEQDERATALVEKLRKRLGLTDDTVIYGEYPCWLLKSILLQGHLYLTDKHVCFFAYLPRRKKEIIIKSGNLDKKSKRTPKYSRYWFILRNDALSYYHSATDLYFPSGTIDLRYAIKAELMSNSTNTNNTNTLTKKAGGFTLLTEQRTYYFHADSDNVANEWVKAIQREIFRSRNQGDSVKIVIPTENIIDLEERPVFDIGETLKIRAIDGDDTYAIDEYVLAFFKLGSEAKEAIHKTISDMGLPLDADASPKIPHSSRSISEHVIDTTGSASAAEPQLYEALSGIGSAGSATTPGIHAAKPLHGNRFRSLSAALSPGRMSPRSISPRGSIRSLTGLWRRETEPPPSSVSASEDEQRYDIVSAHDTQESYDMYRKNRKHGYSLSMVNKVTEMWEGGMKHFNHPEEEEGDPYRADNQDEVESNSRFRSHFSLTDSDNLVATYFAHIQKAFPIYGKLYLSNNRFCFRSLLPGTKTKMILPISDIENVTKEKGFRFGYSGLVVIIHGHEEIFFEFGSASTRDDCEMMVLRQIDRVKNSSSLDTSSEHVGTVGQSYHMDTARLTTYEEQLRKKLPDNFPPAIIQEDHAKELAQKSVFAKHFTMLTIGSRGDVQPYISLCKGLQAQGHTTRIATHIEFKEWIESHGIEFREVAGDPGELMKIMIEHGMFSVSFLREASAKFRTWIDELLQTSWEACKGTDVLIESPSAMAGIHIAEALQIPYFRAFTMPWTRTRAYPHAFIVPEQKMGGAYNYLTYVLFDNVFWKGIASQVNRWRKNKLGLNRTGLDAMQQTKVPFLYNVSPSIFVPPVDFSDWVKVTGYWFLDEGGSDFDPPSDLVQFIQKARKDKAKLVYIGFGSIIVSDPAEMTKAVVESVVKSGVRCILSKGWSDRLNKKDANVPEVPLPDCIFQIKSAPHDWLFPQLDAAVHHGGSGTTGAALRAGLPTIIKPFFGDQFFYAGRIEDLGAGIYLKKMTVSTFSKALWEATHNKRIISKASAIGKRIRSENGVHQAIVTIYQNWDYAEELTKQRLASSGGFLKEGTVPEDSEEDSGVDDDEFENTDGSWMLVKDAES